MSAPEPKECANGACNAKSVTACEACLDAVCSFHAPRTEHDCVVKDGECPECLVKIGEGSARTCCCCGDAVHPDCEDTHEQNCGR